MSNLNALNQLTKDFPKTNKMPVLFLGHGNPMNAIEKNNFTETFKKLGETIPKPNAIVCISAHWMTRGTAVTHMAKPKTIHDFGGFPPELYAVQYPCPGSPQLAQDIKGYVDYANVVLDESWGLDHGAWSIIIHMYPKADIPVIQLSLDYSKAPLYHYELAKQLSVLRYHGVLIMASGNIVHNLRYMDLDPAHVNYGYDWAEDARETLNALIKKDDVKALLNYQQLGRDVQMSIPTPEHYLPLFYIMAVKENADNLSFYNDQATMGSITMTGIMYQ